MSVGNQVQAIDFSNKSLVLVIGENMDLGGDDAGARNGTGKTTIINALSYVFFGEALTNIRRDNLVNKTYEKAYNGNTSDEPEIKDNNDTLNLTKDDKIITGRTNIDKADDLVSNKG